MSKSKYINKDKESLHRKCEPVDMSDLRQIYRIEKSLLLAYDSLDGRVQGLAAPQVFEYKRAILVRFIMGKPDIWYNPRILFKFGSRLSNEGCESEGTTRYNVRRPILMLVTYFDKNVKRHTKLFGFRKSRIVKHEMDHLDGILLSDHGTPG